MTEVAHSHESRTKSPNINASLFISCQTGKTTSAVQEADVSQPASGVSLWGPIESPPKKNASNITALSYRKV